MNLSENQKLSASKKEQTNNKPKKIPPNSQGKKRSEPNENPFIPAPTITEVKIPLFESDVKLDTSQKYERNSLKNFSSVNGSMFHINESVFPCENDDYHEKVLSLLKINTNKSLNKIYHRMVPKINKDALLTFDLSLSSLVYSY